MIMHRDDGKYLRQDFSGSSYSTSPRDTHSVDFICEIDIWVMSLQDASYSNMKLSIYLKKMHANFFAN